MASPEYNKFLRAYRKEHACCPYCGEAMHSKTLGNYSVDMDNKEDYQDLNKCTCYGCGDTHALYERVPSTKPSSSSLF